MSIYHVELRFTRPILGTASADPAIHERFIASKAPDALTLRQEVEALGADAVEERGTTIFPKAKDGTPFLWPYQVKGFFKEACKFCREMDGKVSRDVPAYKSKIDGLMDVGPDNIRLVVPEGEGIRINQRPLRAQTAQGERVALAASEQLPAGTTCEFYVELLASRFGARKPVKALDAMLEWLWYGSRHGIGQWRNAKYGTFVCRVTDHETGEVVYDTLG